MISKLLSISFILLTLIGTAQSVSDSLVQLRRVKHPVPKYVNFDVLKLSFGHGRLTGFDADFGMGFSFNAQLLYPYSLLKDDFPIAVGITGGYNKSAIKGYEYVFDNEELTQVAPLSKIDKSKLRVGYLGLVALKVIRLNSLTALVGGSLQANILGSNLNIYQLDGSEKRITRPEIRFISAPVLFQISYSKRQFVSKGLFISYDLIPRFKGKNYNEVRQLAIGIAVAVII